MELFEKEWKACLRVHGEEHHETLQSQRNQIKRYRVLGFMEKAINLESLLKELEDRNMNGK